MPRRDIKALTHLPSNPNIGDLIYGDILGVPRKNSRYAKYIYWPCTNCHTSRWVEYVAGKARSKLCKPCRELKFVHWKGGKTKNDQGYILVKLHKDDFYYAMADTRSYVREHRLVMAQHLHRNLLKWEVVHHINGIKDDNRIENLELLPHRRFHAVDALIKSTLAVQQTKIERLEQRLNDADAESSKFHMDDYIDYEPHKHEQMTDAELRELLNFAMFD